MLSRILDFFTSRKPAQPEVPAVYRGFAERLVPKSYGGFRHCGAEVERFLGLPRDVPDGARIYLFIGWHARREFGITFTTRTSSGTLPWHLGYSKGFGSREEAVEALANSLRLLARQRAEQDPEFKDLLRLRKK